MADIPWRLAGLSPLSLEDMRALVADLPVEVSVPASRDTAGLHDVLAGADLVLGDWSTELRLGPAEVAAAPHLVFVQQPSVGVEHLDLDALAAAGVAVANTAGANAVSVSEWCVAAALAISRSLVWADSEVRAGRWPQLAVSERGYVELAGRRVGLVGFGAIGQACADRFAALGCPVSYWSRRRRPEAAERVATYRELDELVATSDVLVLVIALAPQTANLLDARRLGLLPAGAVVVNAARGGILDEDALLERLRTGAVAGAALDVFATEPLPAGSPLREIGADRLLLSPHASGAGMQGRLRILEQTLANLRRVVHGEAPVDVVNGVHGVVVRRPAGSGADGTTGG